ncbi:hypothetical protein, partial [Archangium sp.]|uniref:hypothetical protein n=1 Tax=Archangium sp. TaxID=1872627 RepID=UPI00389A7F7E
TTPAGINRRRDVRESEPRQLGTKGREKVPPPIDLLELTLPELVESVDLGTSLAEEEPVITFNIPRPIISSDCQ